MRTIDTSILKFESHLKIGKCISKLVCLSKQTGKVVISNCSQAIVILAEKLSFFHQILCQFVIAILKTIHTENVARNRYFIVNALQKVLRIWSKLRLNYILAFIKFLKCFYMLFLLLEGQPFPKAQFCQLTCLFVIFCPLFH